ncbi:MAG: class II aldolase/adducin family protein [Bacteroidales bacterium]
MVKPDEGYIKFNLHWDQKEFDFADDDFKLLNSYRTKLFELNLIGAYPDGIGFGNLSIRYHKNQFIITGSATGKNKHLTKKHYALVKDFDLKKNYILSAGATKASSESLSHALIYQSNRNINAVIHVHHQKFWEEYLNKLPTTSENAAFGTPEMAREISKLTIHDKGIIIMGGHKEGIITYGKSLNEAGEILLKYHQKL